jgi:hypothetical protein
MAVLLSVVSLSAAAQQDHQLHYHEQKIKVDGILDEAVWSNATKINLGYENSQGKGVQADIKTEYMIYQNGQFLNIAIKAFDPNPENIRAVLRDRDELWNDDNVGIIIDTFNDEVSGYEFFVNPLGAQADMRMSDTNGWNEDPSWDAIWHSAGQITDEGYVVEMSIPFSALRFPDGAEQQTWTFAGWRNHPRDVRKQYASFKKDSNIKCSLCQMDKITGFENVVATTALQITPTVTFVRSDTKDSVPGSWQEGDLHSEVGTDIRWGITQDIVLNATLNPDFSQVEADASQLDINNTYSLFYAEKRPFFLDGSSYFDSQRFNFVHTRNIADPDYGAKITGKSGSHSYGVLVANDKNTSFIMPGNLGSDLAVLERESDVAIAKYKADLGDRNSVGVLATSRSGGDYSSNLLSVDGTYTVNDTDLLSFNLAHSDSKNPAEVVEDFSVDATQTDMATAISYQRNMRDYHFNASYYDVGEDFRADLGFNSKSDYKKALVGGGQTWYGNENDTLTRWGYFGDYDKTFAQDGTVLEEEIEFHGNIRGQKQLYSNFGVVVRNSYYDGDYYDEIQPMAFAQITPWSGVKLSSFMRFGDQIDYSNSRLGEMFYIEGRVEWDANQHLTVTGFTSYSDLQVQSKELYHAQQYDLRLTYQFNMRSKLKFVLQYTDIERNPDMYIVDSEDDKPNASDVYVNSQLIYSYKINPQTLFYLGYADSGYQDDTMKKVALDNRTVFAKFSYAWQL